MLNPDDPVPDGWSLDLVDVHSRRRSLGLLEVLPRVLRGRVVEPDGVRAFKVDQVLDPLDPAEGVLGSQTVQLARQAGVGGEAGGGQQEQQEGEQEQHGLARGDSGWLGGGLSFIGFLTFMTSSEESTVMIGVLYS